MLQSRMRAYNLLQQKRNNGLIEFVFRLVQPKHFKDGVTPELYNASTCNSIKALIWGYLGAKISQDSSNKITSRGLINESRATLAKSKF